MRQARRPYGSVPMTQRRFGAAVAAAAAILAAPVLPSAETPGSSQPFRLAEAYGQVPLAFEANIGQTDPQVAFLARGAGYALFMTPGEAVLSLRRGPPAKEPAPPNRDQASEPSRPAVLRLKCHGANPAPRVSGLEPQPARSNYFIGDDPSRWRTEVPHFGKVRYQEVYPGIDLVYYGRQRQLEFDFVVQPGADPRQIGLDFEGADRIETDAQGDLIVHIEGDVLRQHKPVVYQERNGERQAVAGAYVVETERRVAFRLGDYDPSLPLVIDPVLVYSTYVGGSGSESGSGITVDGAGSAYVTGCTDSADFPTQDPHQTYQGAGDAFVTKLSPDGGSLVYSTFLGGGGGDCGRSISVDGEGGAYVAGDTTSTDFPTQDPYQTDQGGQDAFVTKLSPSGSALVYSTYLGGSGTDFGSDTKVDGEGSAYVTGGTDSMDFPTQGPYQTDQGGRDAFVTKLSPSGGSLVYSTYLGGSGDDGGNGIAVDGVGSAYVTGGTSSTDFPTQGPYQTDQGGQDVFVTKLATNGSSLVYSTYLGGNGPWEVGTGLAVDGAGSAYVTGHTDSTDFPTLGPSQTYQGAGDVFVTKLAANGDSLLYSTYLGGSGADYGSGIAVDGAGSAYVTGDTLSTDFPAQDSYQTDQGGGDAFVTKLAPSGGAFLYSTYLGGSLMDRGKGIAVDGAGSAYATGYTLSTDYPTRDPYQTDQGGQDAFVTKLAVVADVSITKTDGATTEVSGTPVTYAIVATNAGPSNAPSVTVADDFPGVCTGATWTCAGGGGGTCLGSGSGNISDVANLPAGGSATYTATCTISASATGSLTNTATASVGAGVIDPTPGNNSATDTDALAAGQISGTVTDASTGLPLGSVSVSIYSSGGSYVTGGYSDSSGVYTSSSGLPAGTYYAVTWNSQGYIDELYNNISCPGGSCSVTSGAPISVSPGTTTTGIDFGLAPGGRISGTVTDASTSLPLGSVSVSIYSSGGSYVTGGYSDSSGVYTSSSGLPAGTYYAVTWNSQGYIDELYNNISCPGGSCSVTSGAPISVSLGTTTTGIDFGLAPGGRISGTVTNATTGLPLANVQVSIYNSSGNQLVYGFTDSSGVYTSYGGLPAGTYYARTWNSLGYIDELYNNISCPGSCSVTSGVPISVTVGTTTTGIDFGLVQGGRISGTVTDATTGLPLASVSVNIYGSNGSYRTSGSSNSSGVYTSSGGLPSGTYYVRTSNSQGYIEELYDNISCPGSTCTVTNGTAISVTEGTTTTGIDFGLAPGGRVSGTVTDAATGLPLAGVEVDVYSSIGTYVSYGYTNSSGVYTSYSGVPAGTYYARTYNALAYVNELYNNIPCLVSCSVTSGTPISVTQGTTTTGIDFSLAPGGRISGTVTDAATGLPLSSVTVRIYNSSGGQLTSVNTNGSGVYTTSAGLLSGTYYARTSNSLAYIDELYNNISCPGSCSVTSGTAISVTEGTTTTGINFGLTLGGRIGGTVTGAATGLPLANVQVNIYGANGSYVGSGYSDGSGVYTSSGLPAGTYYAGTWNSQGYLDELYDNIPCPDGSCSVTGGTPVNVSLGMTTAGIDFGLAQGGRISGTVTDAATGLPLANVEVRIYNSSGSYTGDGYTNSTGFYTSYSGLPAGTYFARTSNSQGYLDELYDNIPCPGSSCSVTSGAPISVTLGTTTTGIDFGLAQGGRISGAVTDAVTGLPLGNVYAYIYNSSGSQVTYGYTNSSGVYTTTTGLPAGTYYARTSNSQGYLDELYDNISCPGGSCSVTSGSPISVSLGTTTTGIDFGLVQGGRISGTVTDATTGLPLGSVTVRIYNSGGTQLTSRNTNSSGVYTTTTGLPAGTYFARTSNSQGYLDELYDNISCPSSSCSVTSGTPIGVTVGTTTTGIDFGLVQGGRISGTVTDVATGLPLGDVQVSIYGSGGSYVGNAYTSSSGVYTTGSLPAGIYYAVTWNELGYFDELYDNIPCPGGTCSMTSGTPITVAVGTTTTGIGFGLVQGGRISGTVTDGTTGLPLGNVTVNIYGSSGSSMGYGSTDSLGTYTSRSALPSGTYYARTSNSLGYIDELFDNIPCPGSSCSVTGGTPITVTVGTATTGIDFGLAQGGRIGGTVTDATTGLPLGSVTVRIYNSSGTQLTSRNTNSSGVYTTAGLPAGTYYARASNSLGYIDELYSNTSCPGSACAVTSGTPIGVTVGTTATGIDFDLVQGGRISGTVTDAATGLPLGSVTVRIHNSSGAQLTTGFTASSGVYTTGTGLPAGTYFARTSNSLGYIEELYNNGSCPGGACSVSSGTPVSVTLGSTTTGIDFGLVQGGRISGMVTDAATGLPMGSVTVRIHNFSGTPLTTGSTDSSGVYTTGTGLPAGTYFARTSNSLGYVEELYNNTSCPGGACSVSSGTPVSVTLGSTTTGIDFGLVQGGRISGTVTDAATGLPMGPVTVLISSSSGTQLTSTNTDSSGVYTTSTGLPSGTYYARTSNSQGYLDELYDNRVCAGYACALASGTTIPVAVGATTSGIDFALSPGGRVSGTVTDAATGLPLASVTVSIYNSSGTYVGVGSTDAVGNFTTRGGVPTGTYYAKTSNSLGYVDELYDNLPCTGYGCTVTSGAPINVTAGATTGGVNFPLASGGRIDGQVTDAASGLPVWGVSVHVLNTGGDQLASAVTMSDGRYSVGPGLPTGSYYLLTTNSAGYLDELHNDVFCPSYLMLKEGIGLSGRRVPLPSCPLSSGATLSVTAGSTTSVDFALARGGSVSGLVTGSGAGVLAGVKVDVFGAAGQWLGAGETDVIGFYHTPAVPAGSYYLRTSNNGGWADELFDDILCPSGSCSVTSGTAVGVSVGATASGISFELTPQADVSITKTDGAATEVPGTSVTYTIVTTNAGPSNAPIVTVADAFPAACAAATWTCVGAGGGTCAPSGSGNISDTANLPVGGSATYTATCTISASATGSLSNTATANVGAGVTDPTPGNNSATDTDVLTAQADVSITKTDGSATEVPGTPVTYTIVATNAGPSNAPSVTVADGFPGSCTGATWTCAGAGGGTCAESGSGDISDTANLPVGGSATYTATCTISASATGSLSNTATAAVGGGATDPTLGNNTATDTDTLTAQADVSVALGDAPDPVAGLGTLFYFITAANAGPSSASDVSVVHTLPAGVTFVSATGNGWSCSAGTGTVTCTRPILSGTATFYVEVTVGPASGTLTSSVTVTATSSDPNTANNSASEQTTVNGVPHADLSVALTDGGVTVLWGRPLTYTLTVTNGGPDAVTGATVSDVFPAGLAAVNWTCAASSGSSCTAVGSGSISDTAVNLLSGGTATYSATGVVAYGTTSPLVNTATGSSSLHDPVATNNSASVNTPVDGDLIFKDGFEGP